MKNRKQWAKALMITLFGALPLYLTPYTQATWYYVLFSGCTLFLVLGLIAISQLLIYSIPFPHHRFFFTNTLFGISIAITLSIPLSWITYHESNPELLLEHNYEIADATITSKIPQSGVFLVDYTFTINGKDYQSTKRLKRTPTIPTFSIKYLPSNPNINKPADE